MKRARPNIISIVTDDMAQWACSAYGNSEVVTPNLDRLAAEGATFTDAFCSSPVCTPSRAAFLTGLWSTQVGMPCVQALSTWDRGLPPTVPTWPKVLREHGYRTGLVGKWHLGRLPQYFPTNYGLEHFFGFLLGSNKPMGPGLFRGGVASEHAGYMEDLLFDDALAFVERNRHEPFALMLHTRAPHLPFGPVPDADRAALDGREITVPDVVVTVLDYMQSGAQLSGPENELLHEHLVAMTRAYYASIHSVDRNLGRLLDQLDRLDLARNTVVMFTSDNGYMIGHRGMLDKGIGMPIRRFIERRPDGSTINDTISIKQDNLYDVSLRIPLIVRWPEAVSAGARIDELVSNIDTAVSVLGMAGIPVPADWDSQGLDFSGLIRGERATWRDALFAIYDSWTFSAGSLRCIRTKEWKLVLSYPTRNANHLYHISEDLSEVRNLYYPQRFAPHLGREDTEPSSFDDPYAAIRSDLERRLLEWQRSIDDGALDIEAADRAAWERQMARWTARV